MGLFNHNMFLMNDGAVKGVGYNAYSQLGIGNLISQSTIVDVPNISDVKSISCGNNHTMFLMNDGTVKGVGVNGHGQLGIGNINYALNIIDVPNINGVKNISCGSSHTMFLMNDGTVKGVGLNSNGQLGIGNKTNQSTIVDIPNISDVKSISCGSNHTMFLMNDGTVKGVGLNSNGQLGTGNTTDQSIIMDIPNINGVKSIICGSSYTMFLMNDGTVKGVGYNGIGQLGIGNKTNQSTIVDVPITDVKSISCGNSHTMFLMNDGTVKGVGYNLQGQLGIGNTTNQSTIIDVPIIDVKNIICGITHTMFLMNDGTVKGCGNNGNGQLGIGNTIDQSTIISVPDINNAYIAESYAYDFTHLITLYLIKALNNIYSIINNNWSITGLTEYDIIPSSINAKANFETYGIPKLSNISSEKWNMLGDSIEIFSWTDFPISNLDITIPEQQPIKWFDDVSIYTWTNYIDPAMTVNVTAENKIRYAVSKDGVVYEAYRNGSFINILNVEDGMSKDELEAIPSSAWRDWVEGEAYKYDFIIKVGMFSQGGDPILIKNMAVEFYSNQPPLIITPSITPDSIHAEFCRLTATIKDLEGDSIEYRVLIQKAGESEFILADDWSSISNNSNILRSYNKPYFNLGENKVKLEARDQRGSISEWVGTLVLTNQKPLLSYTYNNYGFVGTISDDDGDQASIQISIDGVVVLPFTSYMETPKQFKYEWDTKYTPYGKTCSVKIEIKDTYDEISEFGFNITGNYKSLMFKDEDGNYYTSDKGDILQMLNLGRVIAGQHSDPKKIIIENQTNANINGVKIIANDGTLPDIAQIKLSVTNEPFTPMDVIDIPNVFANEDSKEFYASLYTTTGRGKMGAKFSIKAEGRLIE